MDDRVILVSACLAGQPCRYDGRARPDDSIVEAARDGRAIPACAEMLGGLSTPRAPAEIIGGDGADVLDGSARVVTIDGEDVTAPFVAGAKIVAELAAEHEVTHAVLQARSPSCGCGAVYDGTHTGRLVDGDGVVAALLKRKGLTITAIRGRSSGL